MGSVSIVSFLLQKRRMLLSPEQCSDFYEDRYGDPTFPTLTAFMSSGPTIALALARSNAVAHWNSIIGPANSIKAKETHPERSVCWIIVQTFIRIQHLFCLYMRWIIERALYFNINCFIFKTTIAILVLFIQNCLCSCVMQSWSFAHILHIHHFL